MTISNNNFGIQTLPLVGVTFDNNVVMSFGYDQKIKLRIESDFTLEDGIAGIQERLHFVPSEEPRRDSSFRQLLLLINQVVESAELSPDGVLILRFSRGAMINIDPHERYEAWEIMGPGRRLQVCRPGGEVVVFEDEAMPLN
jgi:hypothetical protein